MSSNISDPTKIPYSDSTAELLRGETGNIEKDNFWNEPFPEDLKTINGNTAKFEKSWNKTHTALKNRRCAIKVELELSNDSIQQIDVGTFLIGNISQNSKATTLSLEDLSKPLIETDASQVKSGFNWYRNIPLDFLVKELIKQKYPDPRNGEVPRDYIIQGIRPPTSDGNPVLSSLGRPPTFSKLNNNSAEVGVSRAILAIDLDGDGQKLFIGVNEKLYEYNELTGIYSFLGAVKSLSNSTEGLKTVNIKKLWSNEAIAVEDRIIYGIAWQTEKLISTEYGETPYNSNMKYTLPVAQDYVIFQYTLLGGIKVLSDSLLSNGEENYPKIFTGEYTIILPSLIGRMQDVGNYDEFNDYSFPSGEAGLYLRTALEEHRAKAIHAGVGAFWTNSGASIPRKQIKAFSGGVYYWGITENLVIPYSQKIGFMLNFKSEDYLPTWVHGINQDGYLTNFGFKNGNEDGETQWWITGNAIFYLNSRPRIILTLADYLTTNITIYDPRLNTKISHIMRSFPDGHIPAVLTSYEATEEFLGELPSIDYTIKSPNFRILPYENNINEHFDPGYLSWYYEGFSIAPDYSHSPWAPMKYSFGQAGATTFVKNYGTKGGIFFQARNPSGIIGSSEHLRRRHLTMDDAKAGGDVNGYDFTSPYQLRLTCFIYDIGSDTLVKLSNMGYLDFISTRPDGKTYQKQITSVVVDEMDTNPTLYIASISWPHLGTYPLTDFNGNNKSLSHLDKVELTGGNATIITSLLVDTNSFYDGDPDVTILELNLMTKNTGTRKLFISALHKEFIITGGSEDRPQIGTCYFLASKGLSVQTQSLISVKIAGYFTYQYRFFKHSPLEKAFYCVEARDRNEEINSANLLKISYDNNFNITSTENLGHIESAVYGESNNLSNLETLSLDGISEIIYGVSSNYYSNPINKTDSKNHLYKYDKYLGGVVELADFSNMSIWDALTDLAAGFNYLTGFSDDKFFFIPKEISATPDLILDLDNDPTLEWEKTLDTKVENIITGVPYRSKKGDIEWGITLVPNEAETTNDTDRVVLDVDLRINQLDDLNKTIALKVYTKGYILENANSSTNLKFSYLVTNNVLESKLIRDLGSTDTQINLPSFFGTDLSEQIKVGDILTISIQNESTGEIQNFSRIVVDLDYDSNTVVIDSPFGIALKAFTTIVVYRAFLNSDDNLAHNQWSDAGVTFIKGGSISWIDSNTRAVDVASIRNLSIGNLIQLGNIPDFQKITQILEKDVVSGFPRIYFQPYQNSFVINSGTLSSVGLAPGDIIRGYWVETFGELIEVGGSKIFLGFAQGSSGTFWSNFRGQDSIEIKCPGLILEAENTASMMVVDLDSVTKYGKLSQSISNNKFIQIQLLEFQLRTYLNWNSKPHILFKLKNLIQSSERSGASQLIPTIKIINTNSRKLFTVRLISKKLFPRFSGFYSDFYILEHNFNLKTFTQSLSLKSKAPF